MSNASAKFTTNLLKVWNVFSSHKFGSNTIHGSVGIGCGTIFGGYVLAHTVFLDKYKSIFQFYKNGLVTPMSAGMSAKVEEVIKDIKLTDKYKAYFSSFYVSGFDPMHMGSFKLRGGAYLGIPANFEYKSTKDIDRQLIMLQGKSVTWGSESGELFQDSLILSENAQKFAIARELYNLDTNYVYNFGAISGAVMYVQYLTSAFLNMKMYGNFKPKSFRYTLFSAVAVFTFGIWATSTDLLRKYYEDNVDRRASALGLNYAKGGVEFYTKLVRRNMAMREIMGRDGEKLFTKYGNVNTEIIRQRHIPISIRKERAETRVQEYLNRSQSTTNENVSYS